MMRKSVKSSFALMAILIGGVVSSAIGGTSEIRVDLKLDAADFVVGERMRGVIDVANSSPDKISVGLPKSRDRLVIEIMRASDGGELTKVSKSEFTAPFGLATGEGQKLEVFLGDHFSLKDSNRYLAKPVLVHKGMRFEGQVRAFDVVDGVKLTGAMQMFTRMPGVQREFELSYWARNGAEHLFLKAQDTGAVNRRWRTRDLGGILRLDQPMVGVMTNGKVVVLHRLNADQFVRSEFWSLPNDLEFRGREAVSDPETAGTARVRELYKEGGVKPKSNPWWKFW